VTTATVARTGLSIAPNFGSENLLKWLVETCERPCGRAADERHRACPRLYPARVRGAAARPAGKVHRRRSDGRTFFLSPLRSTLAAAHALGDSLEAPCAAILMTTRAWLAFS
jgi:hypothetical protein